MSDTLYFSQILIKREFSRPILEKYTSIKLHKNSSSGSRVVPCRRTDRQTDLTKLTVAFRNFAKPSKTQCVHSVKVNKSHTLVEMKMCGQNVEF